ncbi:Uncharacterized protein PCOAH_00023470 [Plasmodium coatneyi]|uniref:KIR protein n=1 Tax=Plasmodium coatneyi TaxID=208452 RepID=A0A1B1DZY7_9APIC|nr:Uncharacterized protein PCOAH_00023470 [Plasmodium coatneyi]ANQ08280.1 Uncharacterized protein PCOAH_00023470 [Plasmodium coatneyi]
MNSYCLRQSGGNDPYCTKINEIFGSGNSPGELKSKCLSLYNARIASLTGEGEEDCLKGLPSRDMYNKLKSEKCDNSDITIFFSRKKPKLESYFSLMTIEDYLDLIVNAYCYSTIGSSEKTVDAQRCTALYHFIGSLLPNHSNTNGFSQQMNKIYSELNMNYSPKNCSLDDGGCFNDSKIPFPERKTIFDYWQDYSQLQSLIKDSEQSSCGQKYREYLDAADSAYQSINGTCTSTNTGTPPTPNDIFCTEFNSKFNTTARSDSGSGSIKKPSELISELEPKLQLQQQQQQQQQPQPPQLPFPAGGPPARRGGDASSVVPGAVSGGLAAIGLPAVLFFLYKYTNLFSGIGGTLFSGKSRRGKRSVRQNLSTSFSDDSRTEYSTEASTIGDLTDASIIYDRQHNERINNRTPGNRNVAYQRM